LKHEKLFFDPTACKWFIYLLLKKVSPSRQTTTLGGSTWRMTAYKIDFSAKNSNAKFTQDFFTFYSRNMPTPCLGKSTITFSPTGKVLWNTEKESCAINFSQSSPWRGEIQQVEWGTWEMTTDQDKLSINYDYDGRGREVSSLPTVQEVPGPYDIVQMDQSNLVLGYNRTIGRLQDSIRTDRIVFVRVQ
jgi:hypothetical protein